MPSPTISISIDREDEERSGVAPLAATPLSHPSGAETGTGSGKAGVTNAFTPGPYQFEPHGGFGGVDPDGEPWPFGFISEAGFGKPIFTLFEVMGDRSPQELLAVANLFAAAPELLEALTWFINDIDGSHTVMVEFDANVERARAALAKARGEQSS